MTPEFGAGSHLLRPSMKTIAVVSLLLFVVSCALAGAQEATMRVAASGSYGASAPQTREAVVAKDAETFSRLWLTRARGAERPQIDFEREAAVFLMAEEKPTGGWKIVPQSVRIDGSVLVVEATVEGPPPGTITTQALTQPWAVIAVTPGSFESVRWD